MKRSLFIALFSFILFFPSLASAQTNKVSLTTYYPAPSGVYDRLRLYPKTPNLTNPPACDTGTIYYSRDDNKVQLCTAGVWGPLSGGVFKNTGIAIRVDTEIPTLDVDQYTTTTTYGDLTTLAPYLGIGTDNPRKPLHVVVKSPDVNTVLALENTYIPPAVGLVNGTAISFRGNSTGFGGGPFTEMASIRAIYNVEPPKVESSLDLYVRDGVAGTQVKALTATGYGKGRVGIRTVFPQATFEISVKDLVGGYAFAISNPPATGDVFSILSSGNVGIGFSNPTVPLEVNGDIKADTLILTSDGNLKKDIVPVKGALDKVSRLQGVSFEWKDNPKDQRKHMGVIAQDVEKIFPEVVYGKEGAKGVDYPSLIAPLIEAVKELKSQNQDLKQQLQSQAKDFQEQINSLRNVIDNKNTTSEQ